MTAERIVRNYLVLAGSYTLAASLIWGVNTLFLLDAGLGITEVFIANALFSAGMVVFEIPTGVLADTLGRRASYLASVAILAITTIGYLAAALTESGLWLFAVMSIVMGLGFTFYSGALEAWLVDALATVDAAPSLDHVFARAGQVSGTAMFIGTIAGGALGQLDLAIPFVTRAVLLVGVFVIAVRVMHDLGFEAEPLRARQIPARMRAQAAVGVAHGWQQPGLRLLMIEGAARGLFFGWAFYAAQPYLLELLERDAVWVVGVVTAAVSLATIAGNQVVEVVSRRCTRRTTLLIGGASVASLASLALGLTSDFWVAVAALLVIAAASGVLMPVRQAYLHQLTESRHRATVLSFDAMVGSIGGAGGQAALGALAERRSFSAGYVVGGAVSALAIPALIILRRRRGAADHLGPGADAGAEASCAQGLPAVTGVDAVAVEEALVS